MRTRPFITLLGGRWLDYCVLALACYAVVATLFVTLRQLTAWAGPTGAATSLIGGGAVCLVAYVARLRMLAALQHAMLRVAAFPLGAIVLLGLALRLIWSVLFPAHPGSDGATYVHLAQLLVAGEPYQSAGAQAYWPIGYPAYLAAWFSLLGDSRPVLLASNWALYLIAAVGIHRTATTLAGPGAGKFATLLFALWPNLIALSATPEKEMMVTALLPWAFYWLVQFLTSSPVSWRVFACGLFLGVCILVQPSFQFLPLLAALLMFGYRSVNRSSLAAAALLVASALLAVSPWTLRNYALFDHLVLVSTNGGDNLYRANNPLATGGYTSRGEVDLSDLDELDKDRAGKQLAIEWIRSHSADFAALAVEKQMRFLGDDATGVYNTFKVGDVPHGPLLYLALKAASNTWWLLVWLVTAVLAASPKQNGSALAQTARLPIWFWLYLFSLHSVFESAGKYHVPVIWALCVMFAVYLSSIREAREE